MPTKKPAPKKKVAFTLSSTENQPLTQVPKDVKIPEESQETPFMLKILAIMVAVGIFYFFLSTFIR